MITDELIQEFICDKISSSYKLLELDNFPLLSSLSVIIVSGSFLSRVIICGLPLSKWNV